MQQPPPINDLFPTKSTTGKSATRCRNASSPTRSSSARSSAPRLGLPLAHPHAPSPRKLPVSKTPVPQTVVLLPLTANGDCPYCGKTLQIAAEGAGEEGWLRFDRRVRVVLREPQSGQLRLKCPHCREMVQVA